MEIRKYDLNKYPFQEIIADLLETSDLSSLSPGKIPMDENNSIYKNTEATVFHQKLYQKLNSSEGEQFYELYRDFIYNEIKPMYDSPIYYQRKPSHRIHYPQVPGQLRLHRDSDYGHNPAEINFWLPMTKTYGENSIWLAKDKDSDDMAAVEMELGEYLIFDGANVKHGAVKNTTGETRVSFDFRIIPAREFEKEFGHAGANMGNSENGNPVMANARIFERCD